MSARITYLYPVISLLLPCLYYGCDPCQSSNCGFGTCKSGDCLCDSGYEQDASGICTLESREKLVGTFITQEQCSGSTEAFPYEVMLVKGAAIDEVLMFNFNDAFVSIPVKIYLNGDQLFIPAQIPLTGSFIQVSGSGLIDLTASPLVFTLTYKVKNMSTGIEVNCIGTLFTKKP